MTRIPLPLALLALVACASGPAPRPASSPAGERIAWVDGTAGRLRFSDGGAGGPPVVFLHGLGGDLEVWRAQLDHLRARRRAVAYDQRGHGQSDPAGDGVYTLEALADDLEALRRGLGLERMVLVAHSMSGGVATTYAGRHPQRVAGLLYLDAVGDFSVHAPEQLRPHVEKALAAGPTAEGRRAQFAPDLQAPALPSTRERVLASVDRMAPAAFGPLFSSMLGLRDGRARLAPYRGPAAAVEVAEKPEPELAASALGLPRRVVPGVSHWLHLDAPGAVNRELDAFLASPPGR
ncbi:MAG: alpha/beta fold hydrolase [Deltaproteobacteria bacterium]|nr:alpha/beta fold hydrolase [Deltaproteobacteria bacterium]